VYSTIVYQYIPRQIVVVIIGNSPRRYQNVYSKTLKLHKGVDNKLQFQFLNQEQKPVDITGQEITMRLLSYDGNMILYQTTLTPTLALNGIAEFSITNSELAIMDSQKCYYSLEFPSGGYDYPVYLDNNAGARGVVDIVDSIIPQRSHADIITIPSYPTYYGAAVTYHSSIYSTKDAPVLTIQVYMTGYTGSITVQGSTAGTTDWYSALNYSYSNETSTQGYVLLGYHPYIRLQFTSTAGKVDTILVK